LSGESGQLAADDAPGAAGLALHRVEGEPGAAVGVGEAHRLHQFVADQLRRLELHRLRPVDRGVRGADHLQEIFRCAERLANAGGGVGKRARRIVLEKRVELRLDDLAHRARVGGGQRWLGPGEERSGGEEEGAEVGTWCSQGYVEELSRGVRPRRQPPAARGRRSVRHARTGWDNTELREGRRVLTVEANDFREHPGNAPIALLNLTCVYCGVELTSGNATKEHVVGRRFVPKGKLDGWWNLIVRACQTCNGIKADLENDISAITLASNASGRFATSDASHRAEAVRKGRRSLSRRTGKPVRDSSEQLKVEAALGPGIQISAEFIGPPQLEVDRIFHLARLHVRAFFYWLTYDKASRKGKWWHEGCYFVEHAIRADWGNPLIRGFADTVSSWEPRIIATTADGFFRVAIRRHPVAGCFSWALEWNQNYRIVGFFGDHRVAQDIVNALPALEAQTIAQSSGDLVRIRHNVALKEEVDKLFVWPSVSR